MLSDLDSFIGLPRLTGLRLAPDGRRAVVGVTTLDREKSHYTTAIWQLDPLRRLTNSAAGESMAGFTSSGDLLFTSSRPRPDGKEGPALWLQPSDGGDARVLVSPPGGVRGVVAAGGVIVYGAEVLPSAQDPAVRKEKKVTAILHEEFPVRYWDHDLGPERTRLFVLDGDEPRDLTGHVGRALDDESAWDLSSDGRTVVATWAVAEPNGSQRHTLVAIDVATGSRRTLLDDVEHEYESPRISPDGRRVVVCVQERLTPEGPGDRWLGVLNLTGGALRPVAAGWDRWPMSPCWTPDGRSVVVAADNHGRSPLWLVDVKTNEVTRLTPDNGAYTDFAVAPDGSVYAMRAAVDSPPTPVRIGVDGSLACLDSPVTPPALPGRLTEVTAVGEDGTPIRAWLALPDVDEPAPLVTLIHGGPVMSAKTWAWRWCPWVLVARGYAVLQPDFALSTGYGMDFIRRGWGQWGGPPYTDIMALVDAAQRRPDIHPERAAAAGASFGGYMTNWIAGHTDRFAAIVSHASIWSLPDSSATGDLAYFFHREMTAAAAEANSPHRFADAVDTPMLITHGDKDYRCPSPRRRGCGGTCRPGPRRTIRTSSCTSPTRTTSSPRRTTCASGTRP
ncbi:S9 family peptidase [Kutzneria kofuensis]|uniref:S9 family peptidase n=1 Tax=Kutzneria kofuensis TaxID=103725 RepID=UPI0031F18F49